MPLSPLSKEDYERLWRTLFPLTYTATLEDDRGGQGFDVTAQQAAQMARVSDGTNVTTQACYLRPHSDQTAPPASGGVKATGTVEFTRAPPLAGDIVLIEGTALEVVQRGLGGEDVLGTRFVLTQNVTLPAGTLTATAANIIAAREGYEGNVLPARITQFVARGRSEIVGATVINGFQAADTGVPDRFTAGQIGQYVEFTAGANIGQRRRILSVTQGAVNTALFDGAALIFPDTATIAVLEFEDLGITIAQPDPTQGGRTAFLDGIGRDRGQGRTPGETDTQYRLRIGTLPDVVSPAAINRICARILGPLGIPYRLMEASNPQGLFGFVWDVDAYDAWDLASGKVWLSQVCGATRFFVVLVGLSADGFFGAFYDGALLPNPAVWDVMTYDGFATGYSAVLAALYDAINKAKAFGVCFRFVLDTSL